MGLIHLVLVSRLGHLLSCNNNEGSINIKAAEHDVFSFIHFEINNIL